MAGGKSKTWIWIAVIAGIIIVALIIWAIASKGAASKSADAQDVQEIANDIKNPSIPQSIRDCRKTCRTICKSKHGVTAIGGLWATFTPFSSRQKCKRICDADCLAGVDVIKNRDKY